MRWASGAIGLASAAHLGIYLYAAPEHVVDAGWPLHARFHVLQAIFWVAGANLTVLAIALLSLRQGHWWAFWVLAGAWFFLHWAYFLCLLAVPGGGPPEMTAHLGLAVPLVLYGTGLGLAWRNLKREVRT